MSKSPFLPGNQVNAYLRDSGGDHQDLSLAQQEDAVRSWCAENGLILVHIFVDEARRGSSVVGRDGFQDMMHRFRSPDCSEVGLVIWNYQRFSRDVDDAQFFRADLRRRGYTFHSLNDEIPEGPMGRLFEAAIDWKNEQFLEDLSRDVKRGLHDLVLKYGAVPGTPPRGFRRVPVKIGERRDKSAHIVHRWSPDPDLVPLVQKAFAMKASGRSLLEITAATGLYKSVNSYTTFFRNEIYIGRLHFGDLVIENYCEPLIEEQIWLAVQAQLKATKARLHMSGDSTNHPRRKRSAWLLSGLAFCGSCGSPMYGLSSKQKDGSYYDRYNCSRAKRRRDCDMKPVPRKSLEQAVLAELHQYILSPEAAMDRQERALEDAESRGQSLKAELQAQQKRRSGIRRQISNITDAIAEAGSSRSLLERLTALEADEADCLAEIAKINTALAIPTPNRSRAEIDDLFEILRAELESGEYARTRAILQGITHRITVLRDGTAVHGMFEYHPPEGLDRKKALPPEGGETVSTIRAPVGAPICRHSFVCHVRPKRA